MSVSTLQDTEGGRIPRPSTAWKYAEALRRRGADPNEVQEIRDALGEVFFVDLDPYWKLREHTVRSLRENLIGLVRTGMSERDIRRLVDEVVSEYGEEGRRAREKAEQEYWQDINQEQEGE